jgi:hypothetical protein
MRELRENKDNIKIEKQTPQQKRAKAAKLKYNQQIQIQENLKISKYTSPVIINSP